VAGRDANRGAKRAREARAALSLDERSPVACVLSAVESRADVIVCSLPEGVAGACVDGVLWVNGDEVARRQRFTLAHELGHHWIGHDASLEVDTVETLSGRTTNPFEIQANAFAAEFLVPRAGLSVDGAPTLEDIVRLAALYGVSAPMMLVRFRQLRIGSAAQAERLQAEIDAGEHVRLFDWLGLPAVDDRLARLVELPYLSPALRGSLLEAAVRGESGVPGWLTSAVDRVMRPALR